ncbi:MAG TPA: cysteine desulfurase family protein [Bacillota bacterium]|nr:cysteine desulfurase family protein [Bacillota bacterium]
MITINEIYLDNSATTQPTPDVLAAMNEAALQYYANPSSLHRQGLVAEKALKSARRQLAEALGIAMTELVFTSGGTEANNLAILGTVQGYPRRGNHLVTSAIEHPSVLNVFKRLEQTGYQVTYLPVDSNGIVDLKALEASLTPTPLLVSIMLVNNETGSIQPVETVARMLAALKPKPILHVDAVQGLGKIPFALRQSQVDLLSFSGHKFHGPKGSGGLYINQKLRLAPVFHGGGQESGLRAGTENLPAIVGMATAATAALSNLHPHFEKLSLLKQRLCQGICEQINKIRINSPWDATGAPHILNVSFLGVKGEVLLHALESDGILVSTGSACTSRKQSASHVLKALELSPAELAGAIRFSFSPANTTEEIDYTLERLQYHLTALRRVIG